MFAICQLNHTKQIVYMIRLIRISSLRLLRLPHHQLRTPELGLCQSGFPCIARVVLSVVYTQSKAVSMAEEET